MTWGKPVKYEMPGKPQQVRLKMPAILQTRQPQYCSRLN